VRVAVCEWLRRFDGDGTYRLRGVGQVLVNRRRIVPECEDLSARMITWASFFIASCVLEGLSTLTPV
jgi:hypothetical protein